MTFYFVQTASIIYSEVWCISSTKIDRYTFMFFTSHSGLNLGRFISITKAPTKVNRAENKKDIR